MNEISSLVKYLSQGVYVIGVSDGDKKNAFTAAWVMQVSFNPPLLALSINPEHYSYQLMQTGNVCAISVLAEHQYAEAEHFGRGGLTDKMAGFTWQTDKTGAPILAQSLAYFDCEVSHYADAGDHKIAVCKVVSAGKLHTGKPMLYNQTGDMDGSQKLYKR